MIAYLKKVKGMIGEFIQFDMQHLSRTKNTQTDALANLGTSVDTELYKTIPVIYLAKQSISTTAPNTEGEEVMDVEHNSELTWMNPILDYMTNETLPPNKVEA